MDLKPISALSDADIKQLTAEQVRAYEDNVQMFIATSKLRLQARAQAFDGTAQLLKVHGVNFKDFQRRTYDLYQEIKQIKADMAARQVEFVQMKRDWERMNGLNQVKSLLRINSKTDVLVP